MQVAVFGAGLVGRRTAELLVAPRDRRIVLVGQKRQPRPLAGVVTTQGWPSPLVDRCDCVVLAIGSAHQFAIAAQLVRAGKHVIATADNPDVVERIWALGDLARDRGVTVAVGAAYSPGVSTLLASSLARGFDEVSSITTAQFGTGGPTCAREHHRAMGESGREVHRGLLRVTRGGSGRELVWFPDPVGAADCYRAGLADPFLLHQAFPRVVRIESRQAATRRDRLTARLPMLRSPHPEGLVGAVWAEVRGRRDGRVEHRSLAATAPQATGAAAMAAAWCEVLLNDGARSGTLSAAESEKTVSLLQHVSKGVRLWTYDGSQIVTNFGVQPPVQAARKWTVSSEHR